MQGLRSDPPPNHQAWGVQNMRVFMCIAGQCGFCICATRLMPEAQKRGSAFMPGIPLRAAIAFWARSPSVPYTVETLTPTFSNTRPPRITLMRPPPASEPSSDVRRVSVTSKRPGSASESGPSAWLSSRPSKASTISLRSWRNQPAARVFLSSNCSVTPSLPCACRAFAAAGPCFLATDQPRTDLSTSVDRRVDRIEQCPPAIDGQHLPRHEARPVRGEKLRHFRQFAGPRDPTERCMIDDGLTMNVLIAERTLKRGRHDRAERDGVHPDPVRRERHGHGTRELVEGGRTHRVGQHLRHRSTRGDRREVDDRTRRARFLLGALLLALPDHLLREELGHPE